MSALWARLVPHLVEVAWSVLEVAALVFVVVGVLLLAGLGWAFVAAGVLMGLVAVARAVRVSQAFPVRPRQ